MEHAAGEDRITSDERSEMPAKKEDVPSTVGAIAKGYSGAERPPSSSVCRSVTLASSS
jgi:hypothetical protein